MIQENIMFMVEYTNLHTLNENMVSCIPVKHMIYLENSTETIVKSAALQLNQKETDKQ